MSLLCDWRWQLATTEMQKSRRVANNEEGVFAGFACVMLPACIASTDKLRDSRMIDAMRGLRTNGVK